MTRPLLLLLALLLAAAFPAAAQTPSKIGANGKWAAYTYMDGGNEVCYMASAPLKQEGKYKRRGDPYALVTNHPASKIRGEVSFVAGYTFKKGGSVEVRIGKRKFELFTTGDRAWSSSAKDDASLVRAMIKGNRMVVVGYSSRGTRTTDTYSLSGFTATKKLIDRTCKP